MKNETCCIRLRKEHLSDPKFPYSPEYGNVDYSIYDMECGNFVNGYGDKDWVAKQLVGRKCSKCGRVMILDKGEQE